MTTGSNREGWVSETEAAALTGKPRQWLRELRIGYTRRINGKLYTYQPRLTEGADWKKCNYGRKAVYYRIDALIKAVKPRQKNALL